MVHKLIAFVCHNNKCAGVQNKREYYVILHCESKKQSTIILSKTSPNVDRFSQFFHWLIH